MEDIRLELLDPPSHQGSVVGHFSPLGPSHPSDILGKSDLVVIVRIDTLEEAIGGAGPG